MLTGMPCIPNTTVVDATCMWLITMYRQPVSCLSIYWITVPGTGLEIYMILRLIGTHQRWASMPSVPNADAADCCVTYRLDPSFGVSELIRGRVQGCEKQSVRHCDAILMYTPPYWPKDRICPRYIGSSIRFRSNQYALILHSKQHRQQPTLSCSELQTRNFVNPTGLPRLAAAKFKNKEINE